MELFSTLPLLQIGGLFGDLELVLKIVGMLFIVSFVRSHIQHPILSVGIIIALCAFLLFDVWKIFGGILLLYLIAFFGFLHIFIDLSFMHAFTSPILNIGGMFRGKPRAPPDPYAQQRREQEEHEERQREEMERQRRYGNDHHEGYGGEMEREYGNSHGDSRAEQHMRYEQAMRQRMQQMRGKKDERR